MAHRAGSSQPKRARARGCARGASGEAARENAPCGWFPADDWCGIDACMSDSRVAAVVGVGPGLGLAVARRFARGGYALGLMARSEAKLAPMAAELAAEGHRALALATDATSAASVSASFAALSERLGAPEVLVYNAGAFQMGGVLELTPEKFEECWRANCMGGFLAAQSALPGMLARGKGTVIFTGATASLRGGARFSALAVGKFGLRALAQSMAREFGPKGVHVAHVVVDGMIDTARVRAMMGERPAGSALSPEALAETYWHLHEQPSSVWTLELDVRPAVEKF